MSDSSPLSPELVRLAFVQEWSDALLDRLVNKCSSEGIMDEEAVLSKAKSAAALMNLACLRTHEDEGLLLEGLSSFGFSSIGEYEAFVSGNPLIYDALHADIVASPCSGTVEMMSYGVVVFRDDTFRAWAVERAKFGCPPKLGDMVSVDRRGRVSVL